MFPLKKNKVNINNTENMFLKNYSNETEVPILPHPGAFSKIRKNHIHEGVDLYCENNDEVLAVECGEVMAIIPFTGEHVGSPWWNNTWSVLVKHEKFIINYGELKPLENLFVGKKINEGEVLGNVVTVLKKDKGRPMSMLHLEMYSLDTKEPIKEWSLGSEKPKNLLDPTNMLLKYTHKNNLYS